MFVHLRLHTEFSVIDGTTRIDEVVKAAASDGQPALAITDLSNLFGAIKFYKEGRKRGVKPIIGAEVWLEGLGQRAAAQLSRVVLLVQNHAGLPESVRAAGACLDAKRRQGAGHGQPGLADRTQRRADLPLGRAGRAGRAGPVAGRRGAGA